MNIKNKILGATVFSTLAMSSSVFAAVGGGATIHNAASMTFTGGQVTDSVNVAVLTIGSAPTFLSTNQTANAGDVVNITYNITSSSNGSDIYALSASTNDTDVGAPSAFSITPSTVTLGASITSRPSTAGTIYIAAGSEANIASGDVLRIFWGGTDHFYTVNVVTPGTPASTTGNITTPETPTSITLTPIGISLPVVANNISPGVQVGESSDIIVSITAGTPTIPGTPGSHDVVIDGTAAEPGPGGPGDVITFTDTGSSNITVLSGEATLVKEVRNVTESGVFATSGVTARTGDVLEYRLTAGTIPGETITGANLVDSIPEHSTYVADSTTLNGGAVADPLPGVSPIEGAGMAINSPSEPSGEINNGETAVIIFQVTVD